MMKYIEKLLSGIVLFALISTIAIAAEYPTRMEQECRDYKVIISEGVGEPRSIGSYDVRIYRDRLDSFVAGTLQKRDGSIIKYWVLDMNNHRDMEIIVWIRSAGSGAYGYLDVFEFDGKKLKSIKVSSPPKELLLGYRGRDYFTVQKDGIIRNFPIYTEQDTMSNPTGGKRTLKFLFKKKKWIRLN
jgi:hypothetical protein